MIRFSGPLTLPSQQPPPPCPMDGSADPLPSPHLAPQAAQRKLRQASTNVKHWNVQMNRLMHPIEPGGEPSPAWDGEGEAARSPGSRRWN